MKTETKCTNQSANKQQVRKPSTGTQQDVDSYDSNPTKRTQHAVESFDKHDDTMLQLCGNDTNSRHQLVRKLHAIGQAGMRPTAVD